MSEGLPEVPPSAASIDGTKKHEWLECLLKRRVDNAAEYIGLHTTDGAPPHALTKEQATDIQRALDVVYEYLALAPDAEIYIETRFDADMAPVFGPDVGGTGDVCIIIPSLSLLVIIDFKGGWWSVPVEGNEQLLQYAIGAHLRFKDRKCSRIELCVVQPRDAAEPVKRTKIDVMDLWDDMQRLKKQVARTKDLNEPAVPGEHCVFCPAAYHQTCEVRRKMAHEMARAGFEAIKDANPTGLPVPELPALLDQLPFLKKYVELLEKYGKTQIAAGRVKNKKLVVWQNRKVWADEPDVTAAKLAKAWPTLELYEPRRLRGPTDIAEEVGEKTLFALMGDGKKPGSLGAVIKRVPYGEQIVDASDKRPAIANAATGFEAIE